MGYGAFTYGRLIWQPRDQVRAVAAFVLGAWYFCLDFFAGGLLVLVYVPVVKPSCFFGLSLQSCRQK